MNRRQFLHAGTAAALLAQAPRAFARTSARPFMFDAMGELRPEYDDALIRAMKDSGIDAITVTLCDPKAQEEKAYRDAVAGIAEYDRFIASRPDLLFKATRAADLEAARRGPRIAVYYLFQNSTQFGRDLDRLDRFLEAGVTSSQLTYNHQNWAGSGCKELGSNGLTEFGVEMIDRMNRIGILLDLSHANMTTMAQAIAASKKPVIVSHTGCRAVFDNIRNTTDANLKAVADRGGVVGICQIRPFLTHKRKGALEAYFAHIAHAVRVAGTDAVAIGSDRDHRVIRMTEEYLAELKREEGPNFNPDEWPLFIDELNGPRRMDVVWNGVKALGYPAATVDKIMGGNMARLYREVIG